MSKLNQTRYEFIGNSLLESNYRMQLDDQQMDARGTVSTHGGGSVYIKGVGGGMDVGAGLGDSHTSTDSEVVLGRPKPKAEATNTTNEMQNHYEQFLQANPAEGHGLEMNNSGIHGKMAKKLAKKEKASKRAKNRMGDDQ